MALRGLNTHLPFSIIVHFDIKTHLHQPSTAMSLYYSAPLNLPTPVIKHPQPSKPAVAIVTLIIDSLHLLGYHDNGWRPRQPPVKCARGGGH